MRTCCSSLNSPALQGKKTEILSGSGRFKIPGYPVTNPNETLNSSAIPQSELGMVFNQIIGISEFFFFFGCWFFNRLPNLVSWFHRVKKIELISWLWLFGEKKHRSCSSFFASGNLSWMNVHICRCCLNEFYLKIFFHFSRGPLGGFSQIRRCQTYRVICVPACILGNLHFWQFWFLQELLCRFWLVVFD